MMFLKNLFGIAYPLIQAPMAGVQDSTLALAVSGAGGLGSVPCGMLGLEALQAELETIRAKSSTPINVNFFCHTPPTPDVEREARWRELLQPYFAEFGIDSSTIGAGMGRRPFSHETADLLESYQPAIVSFHFGLPEKGLLARVKGWGATILASATTVAEAEWLEANGADVIIAQGLEAGGHRGMFLSKNVATQLGTFALLPQIVDRVSVPVVAAGGIADAKTVAGALALGAAAVQVGTAYLLCHEAKTSKLHRDALQSEGTRETAVTNLFSGGPARGIVNRVMRELGAMNDKAPPYPLAAAAITAVRRAAEAEGSGDFSPLWSGQNASGCREVGAAELTMGLVKQL
ncbi:MAG: nitronate monooxygenase [Chloroflexota bacterium]